LGGGVGGWLCVCVGVVLVGGVGGGSTKKRVKNEKKKKGGRFRTAGIPKKKPEEKTTGVGKTEGTGPRRSTKV